MGLGKLVSYKKPVSYSRLLISGDGTSASGHASLRLTQWSTLTRVLSTHLGPSSTALQSVDILHTYKGLAEIGRIRSDDNQIRVVMQVRIGQTTFLSSKKSLICGTA